MRTLNLQTTQDAGASVSSLARSLLMHANSGITYDLQAIRQLFPDVKVARFQSTIGIEQGAVRPQASNADFWVVVDGKVRYEKTQVKFNEFYSVDLELSEYDRFLTLVITDGEDPESRVINGFVSDAIDSDWGMFAEPVLVLE